MDCLAQRKNQGIIEGSITINGYPIEPETYQRVVVRLLLHLLPLLLLLLLLPPPLPLRLCLHHHVIITHWWVFGTYSWKGYVEQTDNLSPYATVYETVYFSAKLRLPGDLDRETKQKHTEVCV